MVQINENDLNWLKQVIKNKDELIKAFDSNFEQYKKYVLNMLQKFLSVNNFKDVKNEIEKIVSEETVEELLIKLVNFIDIYLEKSVHIFNEFQTDIKNHVCDNKILKCGSEESLDLFWNPSETCIPKANDELQNKNKKMHYYQISDKQRAEESEPEGEEEIVKFDLFCRELKSSMDSQFDNIKAELKEIATAVEYKKSQEVKNKMTPSIYHRYTDRMKLSSTLVHTTPEKLNLALSNDTSEDWETS